MGFGKPIQSTQDDDPRERTEPAVAGGIYTVSETQYRMDCGKWDCHAVIDWSRANE